MRAGVARATERDEGFGWVDELGQGGWLKSMKPEGIL